MLFYSGEGLLSGQQRRIYRFWGSHWTDWISWSLSLKSSCHHWLIILQPISLVHLFCSIFPWINVFLGSCWHRSLSFLKCCNWIASLESFSVWNCAKLLLLLVNWWEFIFYLRYLSENFFRDFLLFCFLFSFQFFFLHLGFFLLVKQRLNERAMSISIVLFHDGKLFALFFFVWLHLSLFFRLFLKILNRLSFFFHFLKHFFFLAVFLSFF